MPRRRSAGATTSWSTSSVRSCMTKLASPATASPRNPRPRCCSGPSKPIAVSSSTQRPANGGPSSAAPSRQAGGAGHPGEVDARRGGAERDVPDRGAHDHGGPLRDRAARDEPCAERPGRAEVPRRRRRSEPVDRPGQLGVRCAVGLHGVLRVGVDRPSARRGRRRPAASPRRSPAGAGTRARRRARARRSPARAPRRRAGLGPRRLGQLSEQPLRQLPGRVLQHPRVDVRARREQQLGDRDVIAAGRRVARAVARGGRAASPRSPSAGAGRRRAPAAARRSPRRPSSRPGAAPSRRRSRASRSGRRGRAGSRPRRAAGPRPPRAARRRRRCAAAPASRDRRRRAAPPRRGRRPRHAPVSASSGPTRGSAPSSRSVSARSPRPWRTAYP